VELVTAAIVELVTAAVVELVVAAIVELVVAAVVVVVPAEHTMKLAPATELKMLERAMAVVAEVVHA
jgi:hypothetical protein